MNINKQKCGKININIMVTVKLTTHGFDILKKAVPSVLLKNWWDEKTHCYTTELWNLMNIFGSSMYLGTPNLFENNNLFLLEPVVSVKKSDI